MNISFADYLFAHLKYFRDLIILLLKYRRAYRNYQHVLLNIVQQNYPFKATLTNGQRKVISSYREALYTVLLNTQSASSNYEIDLDFKNEVAHLFPKSKTTITDLKLYDSINNGDIFGIFIDGEYDKLTVAGKTVIDIGANIGDTAAYFLLRGATKVIAIEPYPKNYEIAVKNMQVNNLTENVILLLAGCSGRSSSITVDAMYRSDITSQLTESKHGTKVPLLTLEQILNENNVRDQAILKMDCEGCEYDVILSASKETLQRFHEIQLEYHFGYKNLKKKLEDCGFQVEVSRPQMPGLLKRYLRVASRTKRKKILTEKMGSGKRDEPRSIYESGCLGYIYATSSHMS